ncbi:hypothetical protein RSOL_520600 [Rhizoctonia solani AG-3 Rhs1AP]|uniref:Uncharacterized protein n=2 Tax=Rhizoctonia solani AG-3 TaxID=1086053 RepID=A0A074S2W1_9AGAM|nr:hypothetical protein RSOL_520600 [Rhizoctonia solani AG-3 Rhs1AP]KEP51880.1 hypothetical protein V565_054070 [Rhizoctonia solani 123E]
MSRLLLHTSTESALALLATPPGLVPTLPVAHQLSAPTSLILALMLRAPHTTAPLVPRAHLRMCTPTNLDVSTFAALSGAHPTLVLTPRPGLSFTSNPISPSTVVPKTLSMASPVLGTSPFPIPLRLSRTPTAMSTSLRTTLHNPRLLTHHKLHCINKAGQ